MQSSKLYVAKNPGKIQKNLTQPKAACLKINKGAKRTIPRNDNKEQCMCLCVSACVCVHVCMGARPEKVFIEYFSQHNRGIPPTKQNPASHFNLTRAVRGSSNKIALLCVCVCVRRG